MDISDIEFFEYLTDDDGESINPGDKHHSALANFNLTSSQVDEEDEETQPGMLAGVEFLNQVDLDEDVQELVKGQKENVFAIDGTLFIRSATYLSSATSSIDNFNAQASSVEGSMVDFPGIIRGIEYIELNEALEKLGASSQETYSDVDYIPPFLLDGTIFITPTPNATYASRLRDITNESDVDRPGIIKGIELVNSGNVDTFFSNIENKISDIDEILPLIKNGTIYIAETPLANHGTSFIDEAKDTAGIISSVEYMPQSLIDFFVESEKELVPIIQKGRVLLPKNIGLPGIWTRDSEFAEVPGVESSSSNLGGYNVPWDSMEEQFMEESGGVKCGNLRFVVENGDYYTDVRLDMFASVSPEGYLSFYFLSTEQ